MKVFKKIIGWFLIIQIISLIMLVIVISCNEIYLDLLQVYLICNMATLICFVIVLIFAFALYLID